MADLIIIGSGTGVPSLRRASPGLLIVTENTNLLIDSGPGIIRKMLEVGMTYREIDIILYTHLHPDHTADLIPILFACKYGEQPREKELFCFGGPRFKMFFKALNKIYGQWIKPNSYSLTVKEIHKKEIVLRDLTILSKPMAHLPESIGYRITFKDGKSIAISGDTDYCQNLIDLGFGADLLVLECSFPDGKKVEGHLTPSLAGRIASESNCKKLILTHLYPICDQFDMVKQCQKTFSGPIILAEDLIKIKI